jgi:peptidoglycan/LPS O-acetylase OafA/YrhL
VVIYAMRFVFDHHGPGREWPVGVQMLLAAALSTALAAAAFYLVERPGIELGRRLTRAQPTASRSRRTSPLG